MVKAANRNTRTREHIRIWRQSSLGTAVSIQGRGQVKETARGFSKEMIAMKHLFWALMITAAVFTSFQGNGFAAEKGVTSSEDVTKQAQQTLDTAKEYTMQQKQEYQKKLESQFAELSKKIDELKAKAKTAKQNVTAKWEDTMSELKKKQEATEKKLPELRSATTKAWGDVKAGLDTAMDDLKKTYEKAKSHFD